MIEALEATNFQSWKYLLMEFSPGINAIIGPSDRGKSAIIRIMDWIVNNEPSGYAFRSYFAKRGELTSGTLSMTDGRWVARERNDEVNRYKLWNVNDSLEAFGQGSVKEVLDTFNFSNFALRGQYEQYFLLQSTPGEVSKELNKLTGLDVSDEVLKKVGSIVSRAKDGIANADEQIERLAEEIKEYAYLDRLEVELGRLEKALQERELAREERRGILDLVNLIEKANEQIEEWDSWLEIERDAQELINETQALNVLIKEKDSLNQVILKIEGVNGEIKELDREVKDHQIAIQLQQDMRDLFHERDDYRMLKECVERLEKIEEDVEGLDEEVFGLETEKNSYGIFCKKCGARLEL